MSDISSAIRKNATIPNAITIGRVFILPFFIHFILKGTPDGCRTAFWLLIAAAFADGLDGLVARVFHMKTVLGSYMDPVADKLTHIVIFALPLSAA